MSLLFLLLGYVMKYKLVSTSMEEEKGPYRDSKGLAHWMGAQWLFMGVFGLLTTAMVFFIPELKTKLLQIFLIAAVIVIFRIQRGVKRFY